MSVLGPVPPALRGAVADARSAWTPLATAALALVVLLAGAPFVLGSLRLASLTGSLYLVTAALALAVPVGFGGMPVLSQGAFFGLGAFSASILRVRYGWSLEASVLPATAAGAAGGLLVGASAARLRPAFVAATTWLFAWLVTLFLAAFPELSGGDAGLVLPGQELGSAAHAELALALAVAVGLGVVALRRSPFALRLRAYHDSPAAAATLGVPATRLRLGAITGSAAVAGLAGALAVDLAAVADPSSYSPLLSFELLAAVLVGGASSPLGPPVGIALLAGLSTVADALARLEGLPPERTHAAVVAGAILAALALGGRGLVPVLEARLARGRTSREPSGPIESPPPTPAGLRARGLGKRYGSLVALSGFSIDLEPGTVTALIGPNGSGKSTALQLLARALPSDQGSSEGTGRTVRTLQSGAVFEELTLLENVLVGDAARCRRGGAWRSLFSTPSARAEAAGARRRARALLREWGLGGQEAERAGGLSAPERRLLAVATAVATAPQVVLLDELSAGAAADQLPRLAECVRGLRARGLAVLLVEHNLRFVRSVADTVIVLDAGVTIAVGNPDEVAAEPAVRTAYLGRQQL